MASSLIALSKIKSSSTSKSKTLWIIILAVGLIGSAYESWRFFNFYFTYPMVINLKVEHQKSLEFPAISFCNFNRVLDIVKRAFLPYGTPLLMSERRSLFSCKNETSSDGMRRALTKYYLSSAKTRYSIGPNAKQLMKKCVFDNKLCSENDMVLFQNFRYGNCITFNKRKKDPHPLTIAKIGPGTGLVLDLSVNRWDYWRYTESIGVRVVIHDPDATPSPEDEGFNVNPAYEVLISLKQTVNHRLPAPFKDKCFNYEVGEKSSASNKNECIRACIQAQNYAKCGCIDQTLTVKNDMAPCNMLNNTEMCCLNEVLDNMAKIGPICDCFLPCKSVQYNEVLSKSLFLQERDTSKYYKSTLRLNIFYSSLEKIVHEQKTMFEGSEIFGYLGGEFGLWLGLSVIAVFELLGKMASFGKYMLQREFLRKI